MGVIGGNPFWIPMMLSGFSRKCTLHLSHWFFFGGGVDWLLFPHVASWCFMVPWIFFEKLGCFFQDEARFLWGDVIFWDYWTLLPIAQWFRTKTLYIFVQPPARLHPRFVPHLHILMFLSWYPPLVFSQGCSPTRKSVFSIYFVKSWPWYGKPQWSQL